MPIVDGLTSTKMIRAQENSDKEIALSNRALLNGRVPVIAVSASLLENERQTYINAGFDAWILKPINFIRLKELMTAIVDPEVRQGTLYKPGAWEKGGYFAAAMPKSTVRPVKVMSEPQLRQASQDVLGGPSTTILNQGSTDSPAPMD
jgi:CheY-like chemotaxis protein